MKQNKRIIIKISGESMSGGKFGVDFDSALQLSRQLQKIVDFGVEVAVVMGGGNFWRGRTSEQMERSVADNVGMLATVMNGLCLSQALTQCGVDNEVVSSIGIDKVVKPYDFAQTNRYLNEGKLVIFVGGTGLPYFSTDSALALRACEIHADAVFFVKNVDGVYDSDPKTNPKAHKYDRLTYDKILLDNLKAMDMTAIAMCREHGIKSIVIGMDEEDGVLRVLKGDTSKGTVIE